MALSPELGPRDFCAQSGILWPGDPQALVQSGLGLDCRGAGKNHGSRVLMSPTGSACSAFCCRPGASLLRVLAVHWVLHDRGDAADQERWLDTG